MSGHPSLSQEGEGEDIGNLKSARAPLLALQVLRRQTSEIARQTEKIKARSLRGLLEYK